MSILEAVRRSVTRRGVAIATIALCAIGTSLSGQGSGRTGAITGVVFDSIRGTTIAGAFVELKPTGQQTRTNSRGEFRFDSVAARPGYSLGVFHPLLDTLGIALTTPAFAIGGSERKQIDLAVPPARRLLSRFCPDDPPGTSAVIGFVRDRDAGTAMDSATVTLWYADGTPGVTSPRRDRVVKPDATGRYRVCGLPASAIGDVQVVQKSRRGPVVPFATDPAQPVAWRGLGLKGGSGGPQR